jgi:hypothetical protein
MMHKNKCKLLDIGCQITSVLLFRSRCPDLMVCTMRSIAEKGAPRGRKGHHEIAGVLWESVLLCCAFLCSGVDLQRTSPQAKLLKIKHLQITKNRFNATAIS